MNADDVVMAVGLVNCEWCDEECGFYCCNCMGCVLCCRCEDNEDD